LDVAANPTCGVNRTVIADGVCRGISWPMTIMHATGPATQTPSPVTCATASTLAPILDDGEGWVCTSPPPGRCPSGPGSCITKPASTNVCFLRAGEVECPRAGQTRKLVYPDEGVVDSRTCPCACHTTATSCANPRITLFTDTLCTANPKPVIFDDTCSKSPVLQADAVRYTYAATPNTNACAADAVTATATGDLKLEAQTLCCD